MDSEKYKHHIQYWLRLLETVGFERKANHGSDYGLWFYKGAFYIKIDKLSCGCIGTFTFHYNDMRTDVEFHTKNMDDIEIAIKAMADPTLLPLCVNIKWLQFIFSELFIQEKIVG